jgi:hypothetical protein
MNRLSNPILSYSPRGLPAGLQAHLALLLETALTVSGADKGNLQLFDPVDSSLKIVCHCGFGPEFLDFFNATQEGEAACGMTMLRRQRIVVKDVSDDPIFAGTDAREVLLRSAVGAVHSTPLLLRAVGRPLGVLSCHYRRPTEPAIRCLRIIDDLARNAARLVAQHPRYRNSVLTNGLPDSSKGFSIFCRSSGCVSFVEALASWEEAIEHVRAWSSREPGEFVLFHDLNVVAVGTRGLVRMIDSVAAEPPASRQGEQESVLASNPWQLPSGPKP